MNERAMRLWKWKEGVRRRTSWCQSLSGKWIFFGAKRFDIENYGRRNQYFVW